MEPRSAEVEHVAAPVKPVLAPVAPGGLPVLLAALPRYHILIMPGERGKMPAGNLGGMGTCHLSIVKGQIIPTVVSFTFFLQKPDCSEPEVHFGKSFGPVGQSIFRG